MRMCFQACDNMYIIGRYTYLRLPAIPTTWAQQITGVDKTHANEYAIPQST